LACPVIYGITKLFIISSGLSWPDELVKRGKAIDLGGNGYPLKYSAIAECVIPHIGREDEFSHELFGKPAADRVALAQCRLDEWLIVEAWDSGQGSTRPAQLFSESVAKFPRA
jgi:hypothetical protein